MARRLAAAAAGGGRLQLLRCPSLHPGRLRGPPAPHNLDRDSRLLHSARHSSSQRDRSSAAGAGRPCPGLHHRRWALGSHHGPLRTLLAARSGSTGGGRATVFGGIESPRPTARQKGRRRLWMRSGRQLPSRRCSRWLPAPAQPTCLQHPEQQQQQRHGHAAAFPPWPHRWHLCKRRGNSSSRARSDRPRGVSAEGERHRQPLSRHGSPSAKVLLPLRRKQRQQCQPQQVWLRCQPR